MGFDIQTDHLISARRPDLIIINQKKKKKKREKLQNLTILQFLFFFFFFASPANHRIKLKEYEKKDKYFDLAKELKNYGTCKWQLYQL